MSIVFGPQDGDEPYLRWMEQNLRGYVIAKTRYHWAVCPHITGYGPPEKGQGPGCFTATLQNKKICLINKHELQNWLQENGGGISPCARCKPDNPRPYVDRH